jgi:hypothetical protein
VPVYVLDTSSWIHLNQQHPPDIFKRLWQQVTHASQNGLIRSPDVVLLELQRGTDDLADRLRDHNGLFVPLADTNLQAATGQVVNTVKGIADEGSDRNRADPFVVALGLTLNAIVVSREGRRKVATARPRIPDACDMLNVAHLDWFGFLRAVAWDL